MQIIMQQMQDASDKSDAAYKKLCAEAHDGVSCDGTTVGVFEFTDGSVVQTNSVKIVADSGPMSIFALAIPRQLSPRITSAVKLPCFLSKAIACMAVEHYVEPVMYDPTIPVYRGLPAQTSHSPLEPQLELPKSVCVDNEDGSRVLILRTGGIVFSEPVLAKMIAEGRFADRGRYLTEVHQAAWKAMTQTCRENEVPMSALFECLEERDENGHEVLAPHAHLTFMDALFPCLVPGCDTLLLIPPIKDKVVQNSGTFRIDLSFESMPKSLWLPSLHHNDLGGVDGGSQTHEEDYIILTNSNFALQLRDEAGDDHRKHRLCHAGEFLPECDEGVDELHYRSLRERSGELAVNYHLWGLACKQFQLKAQQSIVDDIEVAFREKSLKVPEYGPCLYMTNLNGCDVPRFCIRADVGVNVPFVDGTVHTKASRKRMIAKLKGETVKKAKTMPYTAAGKEDQVPKDPMDISDALDAKPDEKTDEASDTLKELISHASPDALIGVVACAREMNEAYVAQGLHGVSHILIGRINALHKEQLICMLMWLRTATLNDDQPPRSD